MISPGKTSPYVLYEYVLLTKDIGAVLLKRIPVIFFWHFVWLTGECADMQSCSASLEFEGHSEGIVW